MLLYIRPVTQNTLRWVPASFRVVLFIAIYFIYVVFVQVVTGSCALIFIIIAEKKDPLAQRVRDRPDPNLQNISRFFEKKIYVTLWAVKTPILCISRILFLFCPRRCLFITDCFCFLVLFLCHVAEHVETYGWSLLEFTPVNRSDWYLREKKTVSR